MIPLNGIGKACHSIHPLVGLSAFRNAFFTRAFASPSPWPCTLQPNRWMFFHLQKGLFFGGCPSFHSNMFDNFDCMCYCRMRIYSNAIQFGSIVMRKNDPYGSVHSNWNFVSFFNILFVSIYYYRKQEEKNHLFCTETSSNTNGIPFQHWKWICKFVNLCFGMEFMATIQNAMQFMHFVSCCGKAIDRTIISYIFLNTRTYVFNCFVLILWSNISRLNVHHKLLIVTYLLAICLKTNSVILLTTPTFDSISMIRTRFFHF